MSDLDDYYAFNEEPDPRGELVMLTRMWMGRPGLSKKEWEHATARWEKLHSELLDTASRLAEHREPPMQGEAWDQLVADYVLLKKQAEELTAEAIGIDTNLTGGGVRPLAKAAGLTPAWISRRAKAWREHREA